MHKIVIAGSVTSTKITLEMLIKNRLNVIAVFGYEAEDTSKISGYVNMKSFCIENSISYYPFKKINDQNNIELLRQLQPDIFFVVGLSQLVSAEMLFIAKLGNIGFHPTLLPRGRGRAPIAWLILEEKIGAANFFLINEKADAGPIFVQEPFVISDSDTAFTVEQKITSAIIIALDKWLPALKSGVWNPIPQNEFLASFYEKRMPDDGYIDWRLNATIINKIIRASSNPHPGAYSFLGSKKIFIWASTIEYSIPIKGVIGRVLLSKERSYLIQCGEGLIWISDVTDESLESVVLNVGQKLGYYNELEIYKLKKEIQSLKEWVKNQTSS